MQIPWRKSSYSTDADGTNCLELASHDGGILIRESDEPGVVIRTSSATVRAFLADVQADDVR
ncbi:DUF397 domain-containing protein [Streptomyces sp. NPDC048483]|uniref:DUF397 domain-containing protein n=1 Tax=Streptomyces sp. NPDC048483 TaxID=3154927 RepID=UPI0034346D6E